MPLYLYNLDFCVSLLRCKKLINIGKIKVFKKCVRLTILARSISIIECYLISLSFRKIYLFIVYKVFYLQKKPRNFIIDNYEQPCSLVGNNCLYSVNHVLNKL